MTQIHNFTNGEMTSTKNYQEKRDPFTGEIVAQVSQSEPLDFIKTIQPGQKAFAEWKSSSPEDRQQLLQGLKSKLQEAKKQLILATAKDLALPLTFVEKADFNVAIEIFNDLQTELNQSAIEDTQFSAVGPMGFVLSSNFPLRLFVQHVLPAVLAGNTVIIKFSAISAHFIQVFTSIIAEMALPKGLIQIVSGHTQAFKNFFVTHPGIKALCVTGSNQTLNEIHKQISTNFSQHYKKIKFLGGSKNLSVSLSEFQSETAEDIFQSFMLGQGQLHWNAARLFILEKNAKPWLDFLNEKMNRLKPSESIEDSSLWTPLFKMQTKYEEIYKQAKADQAKLITTSATSGANFVKPIFTQDMSNCSELQQDQVHAPLFILSSVKYPFDIPKYANVSYYGDTANLWIEPDKGQKLTADLEVANISINKWSIYSKNQRPGVKQSSYGLTDHRIFGAFNSNAKKLSL